MDVLKDRELLIKTTAALKKLTTSNVKKKQKNGLKQLFPDDEVESSAKVCLVLSLIKLPPIPKDGKTQPLTIRSPIPHSFVNKFTNILLITRNIRGHKNDYQPTVCEFKNRLRDHGALELVTEIISQRQLCVEYHDFEKRRALAQRFDIVLCDRTLITEIGKDLGKPFYSVKKRPMPINLEAKDLYQAISNCLSRSILHMNLEGSCSTAQIGRMDQTSEELADNILSTVEMWKKSLPGGWINVRSVNLKGQSSKSLPLYISLAAPSDVPPVTHPYALDDDEIVARDEVAAFISSKVQLEVKRSGDVNIVPKSQVKRKRLIKQAVKYQEQVATYDPSTNNIISKGVVVKSRKIVKKVTQIPKWKTKARGRERRKSIKKDSTVYPSWTKRNLKRKINSLIDNKAAKEAKGKKFKKRRGSEKPVK